MSVQEYFNRRAICLLDRVNAEIEKAEDFEANQMTNYAIRKINDAYKPIRIMTKTELKDFENDIIEDFKYKNWI